ncbi:MAG: hypothetical protein HC859_07380 [Bacteroidia bacterium]|nr:hypothetical protein [Bacteroidia bacterium]
MEAWRKQVNRYEDLETLAIQVALMNTSCERCERAVATALQSPSAENIRLAREQLDKIRQPNRAAAEADALGALPEQRGRVGPKMKSGEEIVVGLGFAYLCGKLRASFRHRS